MTGKDVITYIGYGIDLGLEDYDGQNPLQEAVFDRFADALDQNSELRDHLDYGATIGDYIALSENADQQGFANFFSRSQEVDANCNLRYCSYGEDKYPSFTVVLASSYREQDQGALDLGQLLLPPEEAEINQAKELSQKLPEKFAFDNPSWIVFTTLE
jgi:hypothetical protein